MERFGGAKESPSSVPQFAANFTWSTIVFGEEGADVETALLRPGKSRLKPFVSYLFNSIDYNYNHFT